MLTSWGSQINPYRAHPTPSFRYRFHKARPRVAQHDMARWKHAGNRRRDFERAQAPSDTRQTPVRPSPETEP